MTASYFKAGYLPGIADADVSWHRVTLGSPDAPLLVDMPLISAGQMAALADRIRCASQAHLKTMKVSEIVRVLDLATARLLDQGDVYRQELERLLPLATG
ncbi:MAG: acyl-CoA reductase, partial [Burkholderiaceae bacterium]